MNRSRSYLSVIGLFIIAFLALLTGCSDMSALHVKIRNCSDDNLRIERGATNLHLKPDSGCGEAFAALLGFLDKNEVKKEYKVSRSSGMCRKLSISVHAGEMQDWEDAQQLVPKPIPDVHVIITETAIEQSDSAPIILTTKEQMVSSFQADLRQCPDEWRD